MTNVNTINSNVVGVATTAIPREHPKVLPVTLPPQSWPKGNGPIIDLMNMQMNNEMCFIQGVFIDNLLNGTDYTMQCAVTNQIISVPNSTAGYYPLLNDISNPVFKWDGPNPNCDIFENIYLLFYNIYMPPFTWLGPSYL